jgi:Flp pilus assembly protein TadB
MVRPFIAALLIVGALLGTATEAYKTRKAQELANKQTKQALVSANADVERSKLLLQASQVTATRNLQGGTGVTINPLMIAIPVLVIVAIVATKR